VYHLYFFPVTSISGYYYLTLLLLPLLLFLLRSVVYFFSCLLKTQHFLQCGGYLFFFDVAYICFIVISFILFITLDDHLPAMAIAIFIMDFGVQTAQVSNQTRILVLVPSARSRCNCIYVVMYFVGGSVGSALGSWAFDTWGWTGSCTTAFIALAVAMCGYVARRPQPYDPRPETAPPPQVELSEIKTVEGEPAGPAQPEPAQPAQPPDSLAKSQEELIVDSALGGPARPSQASEPTEKPTQTERPISAEFPNPPAELFPIPAPGLPEESALKQSHNRSSIEVF